MTQVLGFTAHLKDMSDTLRFDKQKWQFFGLYFGLFRANPSLLLVDNSILNSSIVFLFSAGYEEII